MLVCPGEKSIREGLRSDTRRDFQKVGEVLELEDGGVMGATRVVVCVELKREAEPAGVFCHHLLAPIIRPSIHSFIHSLKELHWPWASG